MILLALAFPNVGKKGGPLKPEISLKLAIALVFFFSGYFMKLDGILFLIIIIIIISYYYHYNYLMKMKEMIKAIKHWQLHLYIQLWSFVGFPLWAFIITRILSLFNFNESLLDGMVILACIPTTTTTNILSSSPSFSSSFHFFQSFHSFHSFHSFFFSLTSM